MTVIGFTGTRHGMTEAQTKLVMELVSGWDATEVHHGDCIGADADFHAITVAYGLVPIIHPPSDEKLRAFCEPGTILESKPYLERNKDIVRDCKILIATPEDYVFRLKSGTWFTIAWAIRTHRRFWIIYPDGSAKGSTTTHGLNDPLI